MSGSIDEVVVSATVVEGTTISGPVVAVEAPLQANSATPTNIGPTRCKTTRNTRPR